MGCKTTDAPSPPKFDLYQPLINVKICENNICKVVSICNQWVIDSNNQWVLIAKLPIEKCSATFGVVADDFNKIRDYSRQLKTYIENNCGTKPNR